MKKLTTEEIASLVFGQDYTQAQHADIIAASTQLIEYTGTDIRDKDILVSEQKLRGLMLAEVLHLGTNKNGRFDTEWGEKTELGLYLIAKRVIERGE